VSSTVNPALLVPGALPSGPTAPGAKPGSVGGTSGPRRGEAARPGTAPAGAAAGPSFAEVLQQTSSAPQTAGAQPLRFSRHALERVQRRGIDLTPATLNRLQDGVGRAAGKGSRDSVVLVDGTAFVVAVGSRTVVTAVGAEHMREHVFTNIDSAVIA
jgi:flagellar operon protein